MNAPPFSIDASTIREGGGYILLRHLLDTLEKQGMQYVIYGNSYLRGKLGRGVVKTNYIHLLRLYFFGLRRCLYLCNRAPLFGGKSAYTYIHTEYATLSFSGIWRLRLPLRRKLAHWVNLFINLAASRLSSPNFLVQTWHMQAKLQKLGIKSAILPFFRSLQAPLLKVKEWDLCYVSYPWPHKNHELLLDALLQPETGPADLQIALTIPRDARFSKLLDKIDRVNAQGRCRITNLGLINEDRIMEKVYAKSRALLFLSSKESFGLPLVEAAQLQMTILAPQLEYVESVIGNYLPISISTAQELAAGLRKYAASIRDGMLPPALLRVKDKTLELISLFGESSPTGATERAL